jgi:carbonic anhydrase
MTKPRLFSASSILAISLASLAHAQPESTPDSVWKALQEGNARFAAGKPLHPHQSPERRTEIAETQKPPAVVIGCSDSRTAPELVFDQGLGDLFVTRLAGNIVDDAAVGSIEFAVGALGAKLIVVLGHERCGAVDAALKGVKAGGALGKVIADIQPSIEQARAENRATLDHATDLNARRVAARLKSASPDLAARIDAGTVKVIAARYDLDSGAVTLVEPSL